jgi:hypothetical protein
MPVTEETGKRILISKGHLLTKNGSGSSTRTLGKVEESKMRAYEVALESHGKQTENYVCRVRRNVMQKKKI